ncbi:Coproporphyrinogen-III oxidase [Marasmius crinis-equi]|uniref:coproporphyrinogen oxidase n=1 Tax=Marasmius crinis-equi TaxID=585013 RepID=A0ABR3FQV8_9AGAR
MAESKPMRQQMEAYIRYLQDQIVTSLEQLDPNGPSFKRDSWIRPEGGAGQSCVFAAPVVEGDEARQQDTVLEKAGVNISIVHGTLPPPAVKQMRGDHNSMPLPENPTGGLPFFAAGLSLVIHPRNPHAPTAHANYRYFEVTEAAAEGKKDGEDRKIIAWWFGGGADLTPSYLYDEDAIHFHNTHKTACEKAGSPELFAALKKWCDEYFYIPHREETRGVGGIFFDDLNSGKHSRLPDARANTQEEIFELIQSLGNSFVPSYVPIVAKRANTPSTPYQRRWQLIRRGRYVEFNLVYDRGTKFGLMTPGARIESILMSLPEVARWEYMSEMGEDENSDEGKLVQVLRNPRDWV